MPQDGLKITEGLKKGNPLLPIYCFYGDGYLIEEAVQDIKARVLSSAFKDMNYNSFDSKEADADAIIAAAQTFPVMAQKRLVMVSRVEALSKSQQDGLLAYVKKPSATTCLVFISSADKVDKRLSFFAELDKANCLFYFKPPFGAQLPAWVKKEAQRLGKKITDDAIAVMLEATASDLMDIKQEIEKLALFVGERINIEKKDAELTITNGRVDTVFDLADSIGKRDLRKALINLGKLIQQKEEPVKILGMISRQFRIIWRIKALKKKGAATSGIASSLGLSPMYIDGYFRQEKGFSDSCLLRIFKTLHDADIALKSGRQSPRLTMERLVMELCAPAATLRP